jgi:hypothetical protein
MIKKVIKYTDYNDVEREEAFWFNLSKSELSRMAMSQEGDMSEKIRDMVKAKDTKAILQIFEDIILKAYGIKSEDGKRFMKSEDISRSFVESPAYDELYFELIQDGEKMANFISALLPKDLAEEAKKLQAEEEKKLLNN